MIVHTRVPVPVGLLLAPSSTGIVVVVVKTTFELHPDGVLQIARDQPPLSRGEGLSGLGVAIPDDFAPPKPRADFLIVGDEATSARARIEDISMDASVGALRTPAPERVDWAAGSVHPTTFQAAPPSQRLSRIESPVRVEVRAGAAVISQRLSWPTPQAFIASANGARDYVVLVCDTLTVDPWERVVTVLHRGVHRAPTAVPDDLTIGVDPFGHLRTAVDDEVRRWPSSAPVVVAALARDEPEPATERPTTPNAAFTDESTEPAGQRRAPPPDDDDPFARTVRGAPSPIARPASIPSTSPSTSPTSGRVARGTIPIDRSAVLAELAAQQGALRAAPSSSTSSEASASSASPLDDGTGTLNVPSRAPKAPATPFEGDARPTAREGATQQTLAVPLGGPKPDSADPLPFVRSRASSFTPAPRREPSAPERGETTLVNVQRPTGPTLPFNPSAGAPRPSPSSPSSPPPQTSSSEPPSTPDGSFDGRQTLAFIAGAGGPALPFERAGDAKARDLAPPAPEPARAPILGRPLASSPSASPPAALAPVAPVPPAPTPVVDERPPLAAVPFSPPPRDEPPRPAEVERRPRAVAPAADAQLSVDGLSLDDFAKIQSEIWATPRARRETLARHGLSELRWRLIGKKIDLALRSDATSPKLALFARLRERVADKTPATGD